MVKLPSLDGITPDYDYMAKYISIQKKKIVKQVVDWNKLTLESDSVSVSPQT